MAKSKVDLVDIDKARFYEVCRLYFLWKDLNSGLKSFVSRGLNFPETISEQLACYAMTIAKDIKYRWNKGSGGDCINEKGELIEIKATSNFDKDLTSFGPKCRFDNLIFLRLNYSENNLYIYEFNLNASQLSKLKVNHNETIAQQQAQGRRPHIRLIEEYIIPNNIQPLCILNIVTHEVIIP